MINTNISLSRVPTLSGFHSITVWFQTKSQGFSARPVGLFHDGHEAHAALYPGILAPSTSSSGEGPVNAGALPTKAHSVHNTKQSATIYMAAYKRLHVELQGLTTAGIPYQARGGVTWYLTPSQPLGSCQGRTNVENDILFKHASLKLEKNNERTQKAEIRTARFQSAGKWGPKCHSNIKHGCHYVPVGSPYFLRPWFAGIQRVNLKMM